MTIRKVMKTLRTERNAEFHNYNVSICRFNEYSDTFLQRDYLQASSSGGGYELSAYKARKIINDMLSSPLPCVLKGV